MDDDDFNFMLVSMTPYLSNLGNGEAITPGSKKTILQQLAKAWVSANQSSSDPLNHQTCAFDTRFPHVLATLKAEGAIYARDPATQHLVLENGKAQILDVTAFSMVDWLLKENGDGAAPSLGNSMYACYVMLQKRIGCRAQQESASFLKRHFSKTTAYGWPCMVHQCDLTTKNVEMKQEDQAPSTIPGIGTWWSWMRAQAGRGRGT